MTNAKLWGACAILFVTFCFFLVGLVGPGWVESKEVDYSGGLFFVRSKGKSIDYDDAYENTQLKRVKAIIFFMAVAVASTFISLFTVFFQRLLKVTIGVIGIAWVSSLIGWAMGIAAFTNGYSGAFYLSYSFALTIVGWAMLVPALVLAVRGAQMNIMPPRIVA